MSTISLDTLSTLLVNKQHQFDNATLNQTTLQAKLTAVTAQIVQLQSDIDDLTATIAFLNNSSGSISMKVL